ncbi:MAG: phospholipid/cholesterol/gamma-HCH transport system substrate-binding protein [Solirubrobacterales bacterium]|jgi:ABC-type transporter Mla subunit MlaD|nr:phospholipid/cholesterol/gamma-HCH transport system substrate-binding protein [Solirubrobacterales bacterium]
MQKQAPSVGKILIAAGFALSCFGLLLFLWITFGGPIPLAPTSYRFTADFPEATTLAKEADVRIGGVTVGKVKSTSLAKNTDATEATIEIQPQYAPISSNTRAILRLKTLLGETYIELTPGGGNAPVSLGSAVEESPQVKAAAAPVPEGGHLADSQVQPSTQIDEIFNAFDQRTRTAFQGWQRGWAEAIRGRGLDLNEAFGNAGPFVAETAQIVHTLEAQRPALHAFVHDAGTVFEAVTEHDRELAGAITGANQTFGALGASDRQLAESVKILPTFETEAKLTLDRLERFRQGAQPLVRDLLPVASDVTPTLRSVRRLAPSLQSAMPKLGDFVDAAQTGLPALRGTLHELRPALDALDPILANLNPVVRYLYSYKEYLTDFFNAPAGLAGILTPIAGEPAPRHTLRQFAFASPEAAAIYPSRPSSNRGDAYPPPSKVVIQEAAKFGALPSFDCKNTDYPPTGLSFNPDEDEYTWLDVPPVSAGFPPCGIAGSASSWGLPGGGGRYPQVHADPQP